MNYLKVSVLILCVVVAVSSYKTYSALNSILFTNIPEPPGDVHSEYYFGRCLTLDKQLINHDHLEYKNIKGQIIVRGYLDIKDSSSLPDCVYIRASSNHGDMVKYNAYKFTICFIKLVYNGAGLTDTYYYYEWFIPVEMQKDIDWDLYFYLKQQ